MSHWFRKAEKALLFQVTEDAVETGQVLPEQQNFNLTDIELKS